MITVVKILKGAYYDSAMLMKLQKSLSMLDGINKAGVCYSYNNAQLYEAVHY